MASIYARGEVLWMKFKNGDGKPECRSTGYRRGQEALARELAVEVERQAAIERDSAEMATRVTAALSRSRVDDEPAPDPDPARVLPMPAPGMPASSGPAPAPTHRIGSDAPAGALTVREYGHEWLKRRDDVHTVKDEEARLRLHVYPLIGHMAIADVRPKHIRDLINAVKRKTSDAPKCKDELLAPRTIRLIYSTVRLMFKSAVIDEHITASPAVLESGVLPKNVDKDPEWRSTAIFDREEVVGVLSDPRILLYRRVFYAFEALAGVRHGEAAGLRWRDRNKNCEPLGKLTVSRSGERKRTKTQITREIPIHPSLAGILNDWEAWGWAEKFGRPPTPDDLILPTEGNKVRKPSNTLKEFHRDLERIGLRTRRGHDLRRTFVTLARADGGRADVLRPLTHPGEKDIIGLYTTFPWAIVCEELAKLRITLPGGAAREATTPAAPDWREPATLSGDQMVERACADVAGYSASYTPECSSEIPRESQHLQVVAGMGQLVTKPLLYL